MKTENTACDDEISVTVFGEIVSATGFKCPYPISVHLYYELPTDWKKSDTEDYHSSTHSSDLTKEGVAHFSHPFFNQFIITPESSSGISDRAIQHQRPVLLFSVVGTNGKLLRDEGFAVEPLPTIPGNYFLELRTWKPAPRSLSDQMRDLFLGIGPSLQDPRNLLSATSSHESHRLNLFGFETEPSGTLNIRLRILHQSARGTAGESTGTQLLLLERMSSSAGILKSVQAVIDAFQRARKQAGITAKNV